MSDPQAFYLPIDHDTFDSTAATMSPWDASQQHGGPPSALLARAIERCQPRPDLAITRISVDFLGGLPQGRMALTAEVIRPGRRIELVQAGLAVDGRPVAVARAWRSQIGAETVPGVAQGTAPPELPGPQPQAFFPGVPPDWGYGRAIEWRFVSGHYDQIGPAVVWARPRVPLVAGDESSGLQQALIVADSANGLSAELDLAQWLCIPPSLTLTLYREPSDDWLLLDAHTLIDPRGTGLSHATLSDQRGVFGVAAQPLLVQRRSSA